MPQAEKKRAPAFAWVSTTYFAEGYPYTVVNNIAEILFKELGASLQVVGLTALFHLPWNLKLLWGPWVDHYETKRRWLLATEVLLSIVMLALSLVVSIGGMFGAMALLFTLMAFLSATHDIAIDGFYLEALDEHGQSRFVGYRAMAYRVASMLISGPGLILIGYIGWSAGLLAMTAGMALLLVVHSLLLPRVEERRRPIRELWQSLTGYRVLATAAVLALAVVAARELLLVRSGWSALSALLDGLPGVGQLSLGGWISLLVVVGLGALWITVRVVGGRLRSSTSPFARAYVDFLEQPAVGRILAFVILFRAGESFLMKMKWPFLSDAMGMSLDAYGFANGTVGLTASFSATMLGGWLIARHGLRRWIWPFVIAQNALNLLYVGLAYGWFGDPTPTTLTLVITLERAGEGFGTAVFMVYLMRCCDPAHKAAHMAILTALMSVAFTVAGVFSGFLAASLGFGAYFVFTVVATLPAMALIFFIPYLDGRSSAAAS